MWHNYDILFIIIFYYKTMSLKLFLPNLISLITGLMFSNEAMQQPIMLGGKSEPKCKSTTKTNNNPHLWKVNEAAKMITSKNTNEAQSNVNIQNKGFTTP